MYTSLDAGSVLRHRDETARFLPAHSPEPKTTTFGHRLAPVTAPDLMLVCGASHPAPGSRQGGMNARASYRELTLEVADLKLRPKLPLLGGRRRIALAELARIAIVAEQD